MENASKALLMAGGVLIAILIISSFMLFFTDLSNYENSQTDARMQEQVVKFNNSYTAYDRSGITLNEIKSLYNKIESNNERAGEGETNYYTIKSNIKDLCLKPENNEDKIDITIVNFKELDERLKNNKYNFKCEKIEFENEGGRVSKMMFSMTDLTTTPQKTYTSNKDEE